MLEINKIHHWDCLELMRLIPDKSIDLVLTDPPYGMSYQSSWRIDKHNKIENDENIDFIEPFLIEAYRVLKDDTHCYIFCNDYAISDFRKLAENIWFTPKRTLVRIKNNHSSGDLEWDYANITEFCLFFHKWRKELNWWRDRNTLYYDRESCDDHPTVKSKQMIRYLIEKSSNKWDIVLDPFVWSWTTCVWAKESSRWYIGIEIDKGYCDSANKRLQYTQVWLF